MGLRPGPSDGGPGAAGTGGGARGPSAVPDEEALEEDDSEADYMIETAGFPPSSFQFAATMSDADLAQLVDGGGVAKRARRIAGGITSPVIGAEEESLPPQPHLVKRC